MSARLPKPPIDADVDLREYRVFPLDLSKLHNSETWELAEGDECKALINLWTRAWHQVPAGSLPDNERLLARYSGVKDWQSVREVALRGFKKCSDGRLYHSVICELADERIGQRQKHQRAANARWQKEKPPNASHKRRMSEASTERISNANAEPHMPSNAEKGREGKGSYTSPKEDRFVLTAPRGIPPDPQEQNLPDVQPVYRRCLQLIGVSELSHGYGHAGEINKWLRLGCDPERDIYPTLEAIMQRPRTPQPPGSFAYFAKAVVGARDQRLSNGADQVPADVEAVVAGPRYQAYQEALGQARGEAVDPLDYMPEAEWQLVQNYFATRQAKAQAG